MKQLKDYYDQWCLITRREDDGTMDGGDTANNEFIRHYCEHVTNQAVPLAVEHSLNSLYNVASKSYVRHPDPAKWYSAPDRFSRDQLTPLLHFLALPPTSKPAAQHWKHLLRAMAKRCFLFAWNTRRNFQYPTLAEHLAKSTPDVKWNYKWKLPDFLGPSIWATVLRGAANRLPLLGQVIAYVALFPVLCVLDVENLLSSVHRRWFSLSDIHQNHAISVDFSYRFLPTPVSVAARLIYTKNTLAYAVHTFYAIKPQEPPMDVYLLKLYEKGGI